MSTHTYIAFDADTDIHYYRLMQAWTANPRFQFDFLNSHELTTIRSDSGEETIKRHLRERMKSSRGLVLLVGENTRSMKKYVPYEIDLAKEADLPIVVVNLNKKRQMDTDRCPMRLQNHLAIHVGFYEPIIRFALENWLTWHSQHRSNGKDGAFYYKDEVYSRQGIQI